MRILPTEQKTAASRSRKAAVFEIWMRCFLSECVEFAQNLGFWLATDELANGLASFEKEERRDSGDTKLGRECLCLIDVHFADFGFASALVSNLVYDGRKLDARATPGCPKIHQYGDWRIEHFGLEVRIGERYNVWTCHIDRAFREGVLFLKSSR